MKEKIVLITHNSKKYIALLRNSFGNINQKIFYISSIFNKHIQDFMILPFGKYEENDYTRNLNKKLSYRYRKKGNGKRKRDYSQ